MFPPRPQDYEPFIARVEHDVDPDVANTMSLILQCGGFSVAGGVFTAMTGGAVVNVFGDTKGGFNPLFKMGCFPARRISKHVLAKSSPSVLYDPAISPMGMIYACAEAELGDGAFGSDGKMKPEWLLRKLITNQWASTLRTNPSAKNKTKPDWRVSGLASVMVEKPFEVCIKKITPQIDGVVVAERSRIKVKFWWQGRHRKDPGSSHPRILFPSL